MTNSRWEWDEVKTEGVLKVLKEYKKQKLGEGLEWYWDKSSAPLKLHFFGLVKYMFEHISLLIV